MQLSARKIFAYWFGWCGNGENWGRTKWHSFYCAIITRFSRTKNGIVSHVTKHSDYIFSFFCLQFGVDDGRARAAAATAATQCTHFSYSLLPFLISFFVLDFLAHFVRLSFEIHTNSAKRMVRFGAYVEINWWEKTEKTSSSSHRKIYWFTIFGFIFPLHPIPDSQSPKNMCAKGPVCIRESCVCTGSMLAQCAQTRP